MFFFSENTNITFAPSSVEHGYFAILNDDLESAKLVFEHVDSPRGRWGRALTDTISGYIEKYPTYFEIRNFLEIDLDFLLKNNKIDYVEMLLGSVDLLADINEETYKYVARVMFENKLYKAAKEYMEKSKDVFYNDPELHFMLSKYYIHERAYLKAAFHIDECLRILPEYYPAKLLKSKINRYISSN